MLWLNEAVGLAPSADAGQADLEAGVAAARARLSRFAPLLERLFPDLEASGGHIDSLLEDAQWLAESGPASVTTGRFFVKADHQLPVGGSIKARGGTHAVLEIAESVAQACDLLRDGDHRVLADEAARAIFSGHSIVVGSTGNLGLSVGIVAARLGFSTIVHMSSVAKDWKKRLLADRGVRVIEHAGDYEAAVAAGREASAADDRSFFIDDENSRPLLFGYATAVEHLRRQLEAARVTVDAAHPLFVYVPCGVGGAPAGIALGLSIAFGVNAHCFFAEPVEAPCFLLQMLADEARHPSIYDSGLTGETAADGLSVPRASLLAADVARPLIGGVYTVDDPTMYRQLRRAWLTAGMKLEPSAAAGLVGPDWILRSAEGTAYVAARGLGLVMPNAAHVVWTTGGRFVPDHEHAAFLRRGEESEAAARVSVFSKEHPGPFSSVVAAWA